MGNSTDELASYMIPLCQQFLVLAKNAGIECLLVDTGRTPIEQARKLKEGVSWTTRSKHLPQYPENKSEAFDVVPKEYLAMKGWNPNGPLWARLGQIGKRIGLKWGGDWKTHPDPGHWEYAAPSEPPLESLHTPAVPETSSR